MVTRHDSGHDSERPRVAGHRISSALRWLATAGTFVVVVVWVWLMWPMSLGGRTALVFVSGESMSPALEHQDLVVVRNDVGFGVGDVVVFAIPGDGPGAGRWVVHRVVDQVGDGYVMQGDNRDWIDPWRPTDDDVVGTVVARWPGGGSVIRSVMVLALQPWVWFVASASFVFWLIRPRSDDDDDEGDPAGPVCVEYRVPFRFADPVSDDAVLSRHG